jgi:phosphotriesterase-related protein
VPRRPRLDGLSEAPPTVHTVRGPVEPADLGRVLMHEHLVCDVYRVTGVLNHVLNDVALAIEELAPARAAGVTALVECTTVDMGRDVAALQRISAASGVHVVAGTGWYRQPFYPPEIDRLRVEDLADIMVGELVDGIVGGVRAGVIGEIGAHLDYLTAQEERVLRAAARAHRVTGAPITTHASMYPVGVEQVRILEQEGVDPAKVVVGHCDTYLDRAYHERLLAWGAYVQFDTIARNHMNPDARRAEALVALLEAGWAKRLLLSSDRCHRSDLVAFGGPGYAVTVTTFFDRLRDLGVPQRDLDQMTIDNPRSVLAW